MNSRSCPNCQAPVPDRSDFCLQCGQAIRPAAPSPPQDRSWASGEGDELQAKPASQPPAFGSRAGGLLDSGAGDAPLANDTEIAVPRPAMARRPVRRRRHHRRSSGIPLFLRRQAKAIAAIAILVGMAILVAVISVVCNSALAGGI